MHTKILIFNIIALFFSNRYGSSYGNEHLPPNHYGNRQQHGRFRRNRNKRTRSESQEVPENKSKDSNKKKKKSSSQIACAERHWTTEEAEMALKLQNEYMNKATERSILITFPDCELSKEIVEHFHPTIDSVYFQKPFAPRTCIVTLSVIKLYYLFKV